LEGDHPLNADTTAGIIHVSTLESTPGIILRLRPFSDSSLIVSWLTPGLGRVHTLARGARRPKSAFRGKLDLFYEAEFSFARSRRSDLHTLREVVLRELHASLRLELMLVRQASYAAALIEQTTERETALPGLHEMLTGFLRALPLTDAEPKTVLALELKLLRELGLEPDFAGSHRLTPGGTQAARVLTELGWDALAMLKLSPGQVAEIRQFLHGFILYHLGRVPATRAEAVGG
jgi:DNA repair protein RecO (recombination protein O)